MLNNIIFILSKNKKIFEILGTCKVTQKLEDNALTSRKYKLWIYDSVNFTLDINHEIMLKLLL